MQYRPRNDALEEMERQPKRSCSSFFETSFKAAADRTLAAGKDKEKMSK